MYSISKILSLIVLQIRNLSFEKQCLAPDVSHIVEMIKMWKFCIIVKKRLIISFLIVVL